MTEADLPSGTVAFLFTDVEGSTQLLRTLGDEYTPLIQVHHGLLQEAFDAHSGRVVDSQADSFFVVFPRVRDAAAAAAAAQRAIGAQEWPRGVKVRVRMGLHAGEPQVSDDRYVGLGVHRAARICAVAHGGQVLLSEAAASLLADNEPPDLSLRDLGQHRLKDFDRPERLRQLVIEGLPSDFPPLRTRQSVGRSGPEFRILGPLEVVADGKPVALGGARQRGLLALLILDAGRVVPAERLVDALWSENPPRTAASSLHNLLSQLRKLLGTDVLETKAPGYVLRVDADQVDAHRFEQLLRDARRAPPEERRELLERALGLWRGPALAEFAFEQFAQAEIRRLEELRLVALGERIEADLELGRHGDVVGELEALVGEHPLRETFRRQLMLALYRSGRQAEALDAYQDARARVVEELGIDPGPELKRLQGEILRHEAGIAAPDASAVASDEEGEIVKALLAGRVVPVLGLDGAGDLAAHLASAFEVPKDRPVDLARVSQYVATMKGSGPLYDELHSRFEVAVEPGPLHRFLARLPALLGERGAPHQLIVSTNYDLALERAFEEAGEELDVVAYVAAGPYRGRFWHRPPGEAPRRIDVPNTYATELSLERRTILLKLHGAVDPLPEREWESFVITEDDYIDYLGHSELTAVVPVSLAAKLRRSHFLFLGYEMADWNLRLILNRIWGERPVAYRSWAVQRSPSPLALAFWRRYDVTPVNVDPEAYVELLERRVEVSM